MVQQAKQQRRQRIKARTTRAFLVRKVMDDCDSLKESLLDLIASERLDKQLEEFRREYWRRHGRHH
jgi:hypothetical protein